MLGNNRIFIEYSVHFIQIIFILLISVFNTNYFYAKFN